VRNWLRHRGFSSHVMKIFEDVEGDTLMSDELIDVKSLKSLGLSLGESLRLKKEIKKLKTDVALKKSLSEGKSCRFDVLYFCIF